MDTADNTSLNSLTLAQEISQIISQIAAKELVFFADNNIEISVTDNGIGIPENDREQIFARYYKANNFTDLKNSTGLGLAIAKKILDLHQSTLDLVSAENKGSSFIFKLKCI